MEEAHHHLPSSSVSGALQRAAPGERPCPCVFAHTRTPGEGSQQGTCFLRLWERVGQLLELEAKATALGWGAEVRWKGRRTKDPECALEPSSTSHGLLPGHPRHLRGQLGPPHRRKCPREDILGHAAEPCSGLPVLLWRPLRQLALWGLY